MPKYYYTDALKAAWMTREFDIRFQRLEITQGAGDGFFEFNDIDSDEALVAGIDCQNEHGKYYIHHACHEILKLQLGDVIDLEMSGGNPFAVQMPRRGDVSMYYDMIGNIMPWKIIQRQGKAFFMPEIES